MYFEETLRELQARKSQQSEPGRASGPQVAHSTTVGPLYSSNRFQVPPKELDPYNRGNSMDISTKRSVDGGPQTKTYSNLDLIKADTPLTPAKISKMLHQLEFKLQVEMQYKKGIDKMAKLYQADGDKKSRLDAESKRVESEKKIQLLQSALKRYKNLHVLDDALEEEDDASAFRWLNFAVII